MAELQSKRESVLHHDPEGRGGECERHELADALEKSQEARYAQQDCRQEPDLLAQVPQSFLEPSRRLRGAVPPGLASLALRRPLAELVFWTGARNSCRLARNLERGG